MLAALVDKGTCVIEYEGSVLELRTVEVSITWPVASMNLFVGSQADGIDRLPLLSS
jgi:hypothetical protein